jgi:hypothetical protein
MDAIPPVKMRYEQENMSFGCLTKGYMKVLLSQVMSNKKALMDNVNIYSSSTIYHISCVSHLDYTAKLFMMMMMHVCVPYWCCTFNWDSWMLFCFMIHRMSRHESLFSTQIGKGYFVRRDVLTQRWTELCLPEVRMNYLWKKKNYFSASNNVLFTFNENIYFCRMNC